MKTLFRLLTVAGFAAVVAGVCPTSAVASEKAKPVAKQMIKEARSAATGVSIGPRSYDVRTGNWERPWPFGPESDS
jgi:hypothetical protein